MSNDLCALIAVIITGYFVWSYFGRLKLRRFSRLQGGPKPYPILGNFDLIFSNNILDGLLILKQAYSLPCNFWIWSDYYYITDCPYEAKVLLSNTNKSFQKAPFYDDLIKIILGDTLALAPANDVEKWKYERQLVSKAFGPAMWPKYTPVFHRKACKLLKVIEKIDNFESLYPVLNRNSFEIFMENFMGVDTSGGKSDENQLLLDSFTQLIEMAVERSTLKRLMPHWFYKRFTEEGRMFYQKLNFITARMKQLIDERRNELLNKHELPDNSYLSKPILVDALLLKEGAKHFNTNDIYRQMCLIYFTSMDTSVLTLAYTLVQLGMNPSEQEKAYEEVLQVTGEAEEIGTKDLNNLKYLEQCICETIRIYPIVPIVGRHITRNIQIGNKILPKGANVLLSPYLLHRNEKYWNDPETFNPNRFSPENAPKIVQGSYAPFLMGPRDCLGRYYSMAQVKVLTANVLRRYRVEVDPQLAKDIKFKHYMVIKPKINFKITFTPRSEIL